MSANSWWLFPALLTPTVAFYFFSVRPWIVMRVMLRKLVGLLASSSVLVLLCVTVIIAAFDTPEHGLRPSRWLFRTITLVPYLAPAAGLLAALRLARDFGRENALLFIRASGGSPLLPLAPVVTVGLFMSGIMAIMFQDIIPAAHTRLTQAPTQPSALTWSELAAPEKHHNVSASDIEHSSNARPFVLEIHRRTSLCVAPLLLIVAGYGLAAQRLWPFAIAILFGYYVPQLFGEAAAQRISAAETAVWLADAALLVIAGVVTIKLWRI